jgi:hypothetical protein
MPPLKHDTTIPEITSGMDTFKEIKMANKKIKEVLECELIAKGQYYLNGTRLHFDEPWAVYVVNGDCYTPYYRIYISNEFRGVARYERQAYDFLLRAQSSLATRL